ncbi:hypothetical protein BJX99DRAFT_234577 [Aspergillus californicus]
MTVFEDDPERVMFIDFDRAQIDDGDYYTKESLRGMLESEERRVVNVNGDIAADASSGKLDRCFFLTQKHPKKVALSESRCPRSRVRRQIALSSLACVAQHPVQGVLA